MLSKAEELAIDVILNTGDYKQAAAAAGVSSRTIYRWMEQREFRNRLRLMADIAFVTAAMKLKAKSADAVEVLYDQMNKEAPNPTRVNAADKFLTQAAKYVMTQDLLERVAELERVESDSDSDSEIGEETP